PPDLRDLCVLLTGGSKDAATELKRGLDALSAAVASPTKAALAERIEGLTEQRHVLRSRAAQLNHEVAQLRGIEQLSYEAVAPAYSRDRYRGTLGEIVRDVKSYEAQHGWIPQVDADLPDAPALSDADALEMLRLMRSDDSARRGRAHQRLPEPGDLPSPAVMAELIIAERDARAKVEHHGTELSRRLA